MAGGPTTPELVASASNAGGLGSLGAGYMSPDVIYKTIQTIQTLTDKPFAVNLFIPAESVEAKQQIKTMAKILENTCPRIIKKINVPQEPFVYPFAEQLQAVIAAKASIFSFTFGVPDAASLKQLKRNKIILMGTATTLAEAQFLEKKKIDIIVAQGFEAGGHRGSFLQDPDHSLVGNFALIPSLADHITQPVIASGSIMDARGIVAALTLGADGVQMGTAFMTCPEAGTHQKFKKLLQAKTARPTVLTRVLTGKTARGIENEFIQQLSQFKDKILAYPIQHALTAQVRAEAAKKNELEYMSLWAGQAAYLSRGIAAAQLVKQLDKDVRKILQRKIK
jgi:nitronate monooxygenase